jgi:hypothetical protein
MLAYISYLTAHLTCLVASVKILVWRGFANSSAYCASGSARIFRILVKDISCLAANITIGIAIVIIFMPHNRSYESAKVTV